MNPSEANVFSSGISSVFSSKRRNDISYSRLNEMDDSVEFSKIHFQKDDTSLCAKLCFTLLALLLLIATVGSAMFILNLKYFTVEVQLKEGNIRVYRFDQELTIATSNGITARKMSLVLTMHVINRTKSDCWFGTVLSFPNEAHNVLSSKDFAFLTHVSSAEGSDFQGGTQRRFEVYGDRKTNNELSFYVHNILRQLLPVIKVKLYEFVLSKVSSSSRRTALEKHGFLPGRVHVRQTMITKADVVTVLTKAGPSDFESFCDTNEESKAASWKLTYDETAVVNKKTGMVKRSDMLISGTLPVGADFAPERGSSNQGLAVTFKSVAKLLDESQANVKQWKTVVKDEKNIRHPLYHPNPEKSSLMYFAPPKSSSDKTLAMDIKELLKLGKNSTGRSTKRPSMIKILRRKIPKSMNFFKSDAIGDVMEDDMREEGDDNDDDDHDDDDDIDDDESDNANDNNEPASWSLPNFAPFGIGYEVKRKRSVETKRPQVTHKKNAAKRSQPERKDPELDKVWDELASSTPEPSHEPPRVIQTSIMGLDFRAEIDYEVNVNNDDDDDDDDDIVDLSDNDDDVSWDITTAYRITIGQYRVSPFIRTHTLDKLRSKLPHKGQRKSSRWRLNAGDFIICIPLFYIQRLCAEVRLNFDVTVTYSMYRLSLSYPVKLTVHIGQTVTTNATFSAHASTFFYESGFYTKGTVAMATLPVKLSFKEDTRPEWCVRGDLEQKMVRINSVPLSSWNCSLGHQKLTKTCVGLQAAYNTTLASFDLQYSSTERTVFDNWHYPVSCLHRNGY